MKNKTIVGTILVVFILSGTILAQEKEKHKIEAAIVFGKLDEVKSMIEENPELLKITIGPSKLNLLAFAVGMGKREAAELFIEKGMDINWKNHEGYSLLHIAAAFAGDPAVTLLLIEKGMDVNAKSESSKTEGITVLHIASGKGHKDMVAILVENGADVNAQESIAGKKALHFALAKRHKDIATILVENGADVNARESSEGNTALHYALSNCQKDIAELLKQNNADVNIKNLAGIPPLLYEKLPECPQGSLFGSEREFGGDVKIKNPTEFPVLVGLHSGDKGFNISVAAKSKKSVLIPQGDYITYCIYANNPEVVYQVKEFSLSSNSPSNLIKLSKNPEKKYDVVEVK